MADVKHTAKPWNVAQMWEATGYWVAWIDSLTAIKPAHAYGATKEECEANARLISAAPELLAHAECEEAASNLEDKGATEENYRNAWNTLKRHGYDMEEEVKTFVDRMRRSAILKATQPA